MRTAKTLIRLGGCPGWSESSLGAHAILLVLSCRGSYFDSSDYGWVIGNTFQNAPGYFSYSYPKSANRHTRISFLLFEYNESLTLNFNNISFRIWNDWVLMNSSKWNFGHLRHVSFIGKINLKKRCFYDSPNILEKYLFQIDGIS